MTTNKMKHNPNVCISYKTPASQRRASKAFDARLKERDYEEYRRRQNEYMQRYRRKLKLKKLEALKDERPMSCEPENKIKIKSH